MAARNRILVVEDNDDLRAMFRTALALSGFEVVEARDGYAALHMVDQRAPDAIVLDIGLPTVSGRAVIEELAARIRPPQAPVVIVVTGLQGPHEYDKVACVLRKPVAPEVLVQAVRACLAAGSPPSVV